MPLGVIIEVYVGWVPNSNPAFLAQQQANVPGQGQPTVAAAVAGGSGVSGSTATNVAMATGQLAHSAFAAQVRQYSTFEPIPVGAGSEGSVTLANINTALTNAVADISGSTGTPFINSAELGMIQGWASGNP